MAQEATVYEPPLIAEVGDFSEVTMRQGTWGYDDYDQCWIDC
ncbi:lasso RiPP family leader peptide-containing protein [Actinomadura macra]|nr:lasso RiPP family leader peptide-containing protein [Actinomadura macra]